MVNWNATVDGRLFSFYLDGFRDVDQEGLRRFIVYTDDNREYIEASLDEQNNVSVFPVSIGSDDPVYAEIIARSMIRRYRTEEEELLGYDSGYGCDA